MGETGLGPHLQISKRMMTEEHATSETTCRRHHRILVTIDVGIFK